MTDDPAWLTQPYIPSLPGLQRDFEQQGQIARQREQRAAFDWALAQERRDRQDNLAFGFAILLLLGAAFLLLRYRVALGHVCYLAWSRGLSLMAGGYVSVRDGWVGAVQEAEKRKVPEKTR